MDKYLAKSSVFSKKEIKLYHASDRVVKIEDIKFPGSRGDCDFGQGFYLPENKNIAEEWASLRGKIVNE